MKKVRRATGKRKAKKFGQRTPLPPAEEAIYLLRGSLEFALRATEQLRGRKEWLQGGRWVAEVERDGTHMTHGAGPAPPEPLSLLVAIFALVEGTDNLVMGELLKKLHPSEPIRTNPEHQGHPVPDPEQIDLEGLRRHVGRMKTAALNVARIVRGGKVPKNGGRPPVSISAEFAAYVGYAKERAKEGVQLDQIRSEINALKREDLVQSLGPLVAKYPDFTEDDVREMIDTPFGEET